MMAPILGFAQVNAEFTVSDNHLCSGSSQVSFSNLSSGASSYMWDFGVASSNKDTSSLVNPAYNYINVGTYVVRLIARNGANQDTAYQTVTVLPSVRASFYPYYDTIVCLNSRIKFENVSRFFISNKWRIAYNGQDTIINEFQPEYTFKDTGSYEVTLFSEGYCHDTDSVSLKVFVKDGVQAAPVAETTLDQDTVCIGSKVFYENMSYGMDSTWMTTDNQIFLTTDLSYHFSKAGKYYLRTYAMNRCGIDSTVDSIVVDSLRKPSGEVAIFETPACPGEPIKFTYPQNVNNDYVLFWEMGDGSRYDSVNNVEHSYSSNGDYDLKLAVKSGCAEVVDTFSRTVSIRNDIHPNAGFDLSNHRICPGDSIRYENQTLRIKNIHWDFGNGVTDTSQSGEIVYPKADTYKVQLIVTNFCNVQDTGDALVFVEDQESDILPVFADQYNICPGTQIRFYAFNPDSSYKIKWYFDDGKSITGNEVFHSFSDTGIHQVYAVLKTSCGQLRGGTAVMVQQGILPEFDLLLSESNICEGESIIMDVLFKTRYPDYFFKYRLQTLQLSPGQFPYTFSPSQSGKYEIELRGENGCGSFTRMANFNVHELPKADFQISTTPAQLSDTVTFINQSTGADYYQWDFGDGSRSNEIAPKHKYQQIKKYRIILMAGTHFGCIARDTAEVSVTVGTGENMNKQVSIFPNPVKEGVVVYGLQDELVEIMLYDLQGRERTRYIKKVMDNNCRLNFNNLEPGAYILKIQTGSANYSFKLLKVE